MPTSASAPAILVADDDPDDRLMTEEAFAECGMDHPLRFVVDGEALLDYLLRRGPYADEQAYPTPALILLDLNMPRKDGREALQEIKGHPDLRHIPVIVFTTSKSDEDVRRCYEDGSNSFITKPMSFTGLLDIVHILGRYWLDLVRLPSGPGPAPTHPTGR